MKDWSELLNSDYISLMKERVRLERLGYNVLPSDGEIFNAFNHTPRKDVKVVILGQDPYANRNHAHGLAFSIPSNAAIPQSLSNIYAELSADLGVSRSDGSLIDWAKQGVMLLNTVLTVREGERDSHSKLGWKKFTDQVIQTLSNDKENLVFVLWGNPAQKKLKLIDQTKHLVLTSAHPSPLSAHKGFFGSKPFSKINSYLKEHDLSEINW